MNKDLKNNITGQRLGSFLGGIGVGIWFGGNSSGWLALILIIVGGALVYYSHIQTKKHLK